MYFNSDTSNTDGCLLSPSEGCVCLGQDAALRVHIAQDCSGIDGYSAIDTFEACAAAAGEAGKPWRGDILPDPTLVGSYPPGCFLYEGSTLPQ